jgi:Nucleotide-diphospho-sugar transferase
MEEHQFQEIVWTDTDVVWLRNPLPYFALHPTADIAIQTDCLSHVVEANYSSPFQHGVARCGHLPGNTFNNAFNTGMILFRHRASTLAFLRSWLDYLLDSNRMYVDLGGGKAVVGDQLAFNTLITQNSQPWQTVAPGSDWRVVWAHNHTVQVRLAAQTPAKCWVFLGTHEQLTCKSECAVSEPLLCMRSCTALSLIANRPTLHTQLCHNSKSHIEHMTINLASTSVAAE